MTSISYLFYESRRLRRRRAAQYNSEFWLKIANIRPDHPTKRVDFVSSDTSMCVFFRFSFFPDWKCADDRQIQQQKSNGWGTVPYGNAPHIRRTGRQQGDMGEYRKWVLVSWGKGQGFLDIFIQSIPRRKKWSVFSSTESQLDEPACYDFNWNVTGYGSSELPFPQPNQILNFEFIDIA